MAAGPVNVSHGTINWAHSAQQVGQTKPYLVCGNTTERFPQLLWGCLVFRDIDLRTD